MIESNIVWYESCGLADKIRRMDGSTSHISREQQKLLNFDEIVALWYFVLALWYGCLKHRNSRSAVEERSIRSFGHSTTVQHEFSPIHWLILSVAIMGLANFLLSFSLLEVLDHKSSIGSTVLKLSYVNMVFACLRHPCTLSLGVLAPKVTFGYDRFYYFSPESARSEGAKNTTIYLVGLVSTQLVLRLMENLMVLFCFGGSRNSETVKLADFFEYLLDGVFLSQMTKTVYKITLDVSHDSGGALGFHRWQVWWKSQRLLHFLVLYTLFVGISTVLVLIGVSAFFGASVLRDEHSVYTIYKVHTLNDLVLLTGIAILLRPKPVSSPQRRFENSDIGGEEHSAIDYHLLRAGSNEEQSHQHEGNDYEEEALEIAFEMATAPEATRNHEDSRSIPTTGGL